MALNKDWLNSKISRTLRDYDVFSPEAVALLMLTAAQESHLGTYLTQINGPALGIFQMEPFTYKDVYERALNKRWPGVFSADPMSLIIDLEASIMACRSKYLLVPDPIPKGDIKKLAAYWKIFYNTSLGKGTVQEALKNYKKFCC